LAEINSFFTTLRWFLSHVAKQIAHIYGIANATYTYLWTPSEGFAFLLVHLKVLFSFWIGRNTRSQYVYGLPVLF